ncbi:hypothetical protein [Globicatella sp. HMSC072A10]|uniref:hypothetical protein n=1 Tax=Globicatella sp. HMSC072A10 TaxID=1739315 RepID=UPI00143BD731|nr:hypothetical protein [Globicatella sp. HMSC072A10]
MLGMNSYVASKGDRICGERSFNKLSLTEDTRIFSSCRKKFYKKRKNEAKRANSI